VPRRARQQDAKNDFERMSEKVKEEVNKVFNPEFLTGWTT